MPLESMFVLEAKKTSSHIFVGTRRQRMCRIGDLEFPKSVRISRILIGRYFLVCLGETLEPRAPSESLC